LSYENLQKFLKWCQNKVQYVEIWLYNEV
jgi:hypothetical protein